MLVGRLPVAEAFFQKVMAAKNEDDIWRLVSGFPHLNDSLASLRTHITLRRMGPHRRWAPHVSRFSLRLMGLAHYRAVDSAPGAE